MPKFISDHTKNVKLYLNWLPVHLVITVECKRALEVFSRHMLSAWGRYFVVCREYEMGSKLHFFQ